MKKSKVLSLLLCGAMTASLAACGGAYEKDTTTAAATDAAAGSAASENASSTSGDKIFRYSITSEATTLDPNKSDSIADAELQHAMTEGLVRNTAGEISPGIAESWELSDDGLTYTFHLRDAKWSDGEPIKAGDFVYSLQRLMDPNTASVYAFIGEYIKNGAAVESGKMQPSELGVSAPDDHTLVITLEHPTAYFLSLVGSLAEYAPIRQDIVEKYGTDFAGDASKNVYSGPFMLTSSAAQKYVFEKNPNYWNADNVKLDGAEVSVIADQNTALAMYESGDLDFVKIPTDAVPNYDDKDQEYMNGNEDYLYINQGGSNPLLANKNFRLALNYGINRNAYIQLATNNVYTPTNTLVMPLVNGVEKTYGEEYPMSEKSYPMDGDPDKAKQYLEAAMKDLGIAKASDITVTITTTDAESSKKIAEVCQNLLNSALGINVEVRQVTYKNIYGEVLPKGDYELAYAGWGPDYPDPYTYLELFKSDNPYNYSKYKNDEFDSLLKASNTETDKKARMDMLNKAEQIVLDDGALVPLQCRQEHYLLNPQMKNVSFYFSGLNLDWPFAEKD
ncbi:peptide ABC transporter substrate-binding protein [Clostridium vitabionis]|uniref:peptide ABC transporter substrate-binding protein n=1 Tax=Clostridium vitabionis TaxID=2784388 RepID=UPI00188C3953|nr:peptide ABC transporter substrate-binding protein [Clostridium vitabionis]